MTDNRPPQRERLPLEVEQQIDRLSDAFESAWKRGARPQMEDYLPRIAADYLPALLRQLVAVEAELRAAHNERPDVDEYLARFPDQHDAVLAGLALFDPDLTGLARKEPPRRQSTQEPPDPATIGRFQIKQRLGRGGYGVVYLAHDPGLDRLVALKVPRVELLTTDKARENFLHEARTAAKLEHPSLVPVYEVQHDRDLIYIVQKYIEGQNLAQWAALHTRSWEEITGRLIEIATAIDYVHRQGFYHRDLKPGNILIDKSGRAHVADFGLAVHETSVRMLKGQAAGTPRYMSPEQIRGETHRIDNRTDIWALGVILYELLAGQHPFTADEPLDLVEEIQELDPKSPRTRNPDVPRELERICFKCLAKRRTHRYATAADLMEDLDAFLATRSKSSGSPGGGEKMLSESGTDPVVIGSATVRGTSDSTLQDATPTPQSDSQPPLRIVPKGLRSFDEKDKDFFLELLPGPRDREGLPDSIRFWKTLIEETDADRTFPVGVMYGPSGCGKSSLVKAGLLPRLAEHVLPVFVEATPHDTELRLLKTLRKHIPGLTKEASLAEVLTQLREGHVTDGQKVLLVLDQFEQWLHSTTDIDNSQLVRALRQCDGANVQCLVLVRDDFWMSTTRFMQTLEIRQVEGENSAAVDLFDPIHARRVLRAFGLAYGRLPEHELAGEQQQFLDRAVQDLTDDGKVICVQLSLFADMMKGRQWTPGSLQEVGGTSGVGVAFLDETFTAKTAPPTHRLHAKAAQAVLKALLPEVGTDIKGQMQAAERLLEVSGYASRHDDFRDLLQILNSQLRLITPTEPEEAVAGDAEPTAGSPQRYYQLTHDYLVRSLRDWLTRKQKETRRGRAELKLAERAALWNAKPKNRHLPSLWEYATIRTWTRQGDWSGPQRNMMRRAGRWHVTRWGAGLLVVLLMSLGIWQMVERERGKSLRERMKNLQEQVRTTVASVSNSRGPVAPYAIKELQAFPADMVFGELQSAFADSDNSSDQKLALAYALAQRGQTQSVLPLLLESIKTAPSDEVDNLATALALERDHAVAEISRAAEVATAQKNWELKTRLATMALYLDDTSIATEMLRTEPPDTEAAQSAAEAEPDWHDAPPDPTWPQVAGDTQAAIGSAHGLLAERFAYCLDMPWESFLAIVETLRSSGYRPTRVRPFVADGQRRVAAVWTRDARKFQLDHDQTPAQLPSPDADAVRDGLVPLDVAGYMSEGDKTLYCVLWSEPLASEEQRRLRVGIPKTDWETTSGAMVQAGFLPRTVQLCSTAEGPPCCAAIWSNHAPQTGANVGLSDRQVRTGHVIWEDVSVAVPNKLTNPLELQRQQLAALDALPAEEQNTPDRRRTRGKARYYLDQPHEALTDFEALATQSPPDAEALLYSALCRAQLGQAEEATAAMTKVLESKQGPVWNAYGQILMNAWLGQVEEARRGLENLVPEDGTDSGAFYNAACAAAQLTRILKDSDPADLAAWKEQSLAWLQRAYELGHSDSNGIDNDADFAPLCDDPAFQALERELLATQLYAGVWRQGADRQCWVDTAASWDELQQAAGARVAEDARPVAVAVNVQADPSPLQVTLVWQRPRTAARPIRTWDPVQRTEFIEQFRNWSGSVESLVEVLQRDNDAALRSGICLALGSMEQPSPDAKRTWESVLVDWHQGQPDKGVHGATGWALRAWNLPLPNFEKGVQTPAEFQWRVTKKGLTMMRISAGQVNRPENPEYREERETIRIAHDFWLSDREVTAGLFMEFLDDTSYQFEKPGESEEIRTPNTSNPALPVVYVSWYDAVLFCNWLSRQEDLQPCYEKAGKEQIRDYDNKVREYDAWKRIPSANGYRLPTEDEWEYACRARTTTAYAFGDDEDLLDRYAVFVKNAKNGPAAAGEKLCHAWGLFDMHGNVWEWCEDWHQQGVDRVYRGGGWYYSATLCQSAYRLWYQPSYRNDFLGFRVAAAVSSE